MIRPMKIKELKLFGFTELIQLIAFQITLKKICSQLGLHIN